MALKKISSYFKSMATQWNLFWFSPTDLYNVSLFRCLLGCTMLVMYAIRAANFEFFFTSQGVMPVSMALEAMPPGYQTVLPFFASTDLGIQWQGALHLILIALFTLGVFGRSLTWLLFAVNLGLCQRNISIVYGADLFSSFWLFYLSFIDHNRHFSILNVLFKRTRAEKASLKSTRGFSSDVVSSDLVSSDLVSSMAIRLIQIQLCISYAYTGIEKLKGMQWWEGSAVWYVVGMDDLVPFDLAFLKHVPSLVALLSMATVIFEVYFIFAVWNKKLVKPWLIVGFTFHLFTAIFMDLKFFFLVMTLSYLLFLPSLRPLVEEWFRRFGFRRKRRS